MREDTKKVLCELQERAIKDIKKLLEKPDISPTEWKSAGDAVDIIKDVECSIKDALTSMAMEDEYGELEDYGESEKGGMNYRRGPRIRYSMEDSFTGRGMGTGTRGRNSYGGDYMRGSYASGNSYSNGSSYSNGNQTTIANLRNLMNNASSESERMMYQRFIEEAERM